MLRRNLSFNWMGGQNIWRYADRMNLKSFFPLLGTAMLASFLVAGSSVVACSSSADAPADASTDTGEPTSDAGTQDTGLPTDATGAQDSGPDVLIPTTPEVQYLGRVDLSDKTRPLLAYPGATVRVRFSGTTLKGSFRETPGPIAGGTLADYSQYSVFVDGAPTKIIKLLSGSNPDVVIADNLAAGEHIIDVVRRTEAAFGTTTVTDINVGTGTLLPPPPRATRRIEFIGDSITVGYGNQLIGPYGKNEEFGGRPDSTCPAVGSDNVSPRINAENYLDSYSAKIAASVSAEAHVVAYSGKGLTRNLVPAEAVKLADYYPLANPLVPSAKWDFASWTADAVVLNIGTNDAAAGDPGVAFATQYEAFLKTVRAHYPNAPIWAVVGPMLTDFGTTPNLKATMITYIRDTAVKHLVDAGDKKIFYLEVSQDTSKYGCEYHPYKDSTTGMADAVVRELKTELKW